MDLMICGCEIIDFPSIRYPTLWNARVHIRLLGTVVIMFHAHPPWLYACTASPPVVCCISRHGLLTRTYRQP